MRGGIVGIQLDRQAVLLGGPCVVAAHRERRAVPGAERHVLGVDLHRVLVALHGGQPVGAARDGQRMPHADAHRRVVGIDGDGPPVPPDGLLVAARLHQQVAHAEERKHAAGAGLGGLPVGGLRLGGPAQARERVGPAHSPPQAAVLVVRPALVLVAHPEGLQGRLARGARAAVGIHYRCLDEEGGGPVTWPVRLHVQHDRLDDEKGLSLVEPGPAERVDYVVPQVERAGEVTAVPVEALQQGGKSAFARQLPDGLDVLKSAH